MSDTGLPTVRPARPKHSRSTSITTQKTTSHQRKPSFSQLPSSENIKRIRTSTTTTSSAPKVTNVPGFLNTIISKIDTFLNPTTPLLPHSKHGNAFGGTTNHSFLTRLSQSRILRIFSLFYVIFSICLTIQHSWQYYKNPTPKVPKVTNSLGQEENFVDWKPQRTYDQGTN